MKKSSLKNYITLLEAAADAAANARDYWMREHERRVEELLEADSEIAELKADAANARDYWIREHKLLEAKNHIAELERRLDDNCGLCTLRAKLTNETCLEALTRLREANEVKDQELLEAKNYIAELERRNK